jgi:transcriptional regulator
MYQPPHFREPELAPQHALIRANPLGLLISNGPDGILADPIPFLLHDEGERGVLRCHIARANPQWQALQAAPEALVVFQGIDRYITPNWYAQKAIDHKVVPTWNYAIVEARGPAAVIDDPAWLLAQVSALTTTHEQGAPHPWAVADAPDSFVASQLKGIVGIEIPIAALTGKFKASQNRPAADRLGILAGLATAGDARSLAMRDLVKARNGL